MNLIGDYSLIAFQEAVYIGCDNDLTQLKKAEQNVTFSQSSNIQLINSSVTSKLEIK